MPMINEAVYTLYEGVGNVKSIDESLKLGANHPMGPLELADFIGLDTCLAIMNVLHEGLGIPNTGPARCCRNMSRPGGWAARPSGGSMTIAAKCRCRRGEPGEEPPRVAFPVLQLVRRDRFADHGAGWFEQAALDFVQEQALPQRVADLVGDLEHAGVLAGEVDRQDRRAG
jgi:hypothetical protein